jgi:hypothetical protein
MAAWTQEELRKIAKTDDLHIAPFREDGKTYGTPTWIWSVVVDGALYVRAYSGQNSRWYRAAMRQRAGRITAAGVTKDVAFEPVDGEINDRIDDGYRAKYKGSPYLDPMIAKRARSATVQVTPRESKPRQPYITAKEKLNASCHREAVAGKVRRAEGSPRGGDY